MDFEPGPLLKNINSPADLKKLSIEQLPQVCKELRQYIVDVVSVHGGHFGASLGVVELTVAIHYVFDTPTDQLVWDVGHQAYGHKILTGRRDNFYTNRKYKGVAPFPKRAESIFDTFGVGHSSTSISAALGMAEASRIKGETKKQHIAVIGDGAMTAGLAFEGLNNAGTSKANLIVVLNDNNMSIDPNVGALKDYLTDITTSHTYNKLRNDAWHLLGKINKITGVQDLASKLEHSVKTLLLNGSNIFESLKFRYFGPTDGHDVIRMVKILEDLKDIPGPKLFHIKTIKGKGYKLAEEDQTKWHAPGLFDKVTGEIYKTPNPQPKPPKYQDVFGHTLVELAKANPKIVGITPAMPSGSSMNIMMREIPERAFDVGIAEQHAVTFSAGLATQGLIPFCNIYSSFMQRAYDQVIHDVCIQNLHVVLCMDRGGLVGADGPTHHGSFDFAFMRCLPNMIVSAPMNEEELRNLMFTATQEGIGPFSIRYPRGEGVMIDWKTPLKNIPIGKGQKICDGDDIAILSIGHIGNFVVKATKMLNDTEVYPAHYDMRFVKPLDSEILHEVFGKHKNIITVEDGCVEGGFGSAILEWMAENNYQANVVRIGIPDEFIEHGEPMELYKECNMHPEGIAQKVREVLGVKAVANPFTF
ncbi:MAG: 1-deoxy-D-xylulose-5-phosphate synthase [Bacteroidetes bacterium]|nr:1-deoxy-D-xylulose-5-phosphate synthase [Bacteroidota bacterium]